MNATTIAVDLAKSVFQVALVEQTRLTRAPFEHGIDNRAGPGGDGGLRLAGTP